MSPDSGTSPATTGTGGTAPEKPKLPVSVHLMCGWPLFLVAVGGAIGGALGGGAYGLNVAIYNSRLPAPAKVALNLLAGGAAVGLWYAISTAIRTRMG